MEKPFWNDIGSKYKFISIFPICGIVGYFGKRSAQEFLLEGLRRLEYRGYDSAGVALIEKGKLKVTRSVGKVSALEERLTERSNASMIDIAHTRRAIVTGKC